MAFDFWTPSKVLTASITLRLALLFYGLLQDAFSPLKYTDIDYLVFTDAARYVSNGHSPYCRETYRYTPLLAWLLIPTARPGWFVFGKVVFGAADVVAGWLLVLILRCDGLETRQALRFASIWLLNPMVATISTRGSSEGLLGVIVAALVWAITRGRVRLAGVLLGFGVHFKIYPFIYAPSLFLYLESPGRSLSSILNASRISLTLTSFLTFTALNLSMYALYGPPFLQHTYLHHVSRIDHRHNFSPYNTLLYASSASASTGLLKLESLAFVPQLSLSAVLLPFLAKRHLPGAMLAQTWAFVALNKVCTSQYFLWYLTLLPFYLPYSSLLAKPRYGIFLLALWVLAQVLWLQQGFQLEFLGKSTFVPGLWIAGIGFYVVNMVILGVIVDDVGGMRKDQPVRKNSAKATS